MCIYTYIRIYIYIYTYIHLYEYVYIYMPPCRKHSCVYNVKPKAPVTNHPVLQSSSFPILQFSRSSSSWSRSLETHSGESILRGVQGGPLRVLAWIPTLQEEPPEPKFGYLASSWRSCALSWLVLALLGLILSPSCSKMAPRWPNIAQHSAKMRQYSAKMGQDRLPERP